MGRLSSVPAQTQTAGLVADSDVLCQRARPNPRTWCRRGDYPGEPEGFNPSEPTISRHFQVVRLHGPFPVDHAHLLFGSPSICDATYRQRYSSSAERRLRAVLADAASRSCGWRNLSDLRRAVDTVAVVDGVVRRSTTGADTAESLHHPNAAGWATYRRHPMNYHA
jgi:hypothetical protein